MHILQQSYSGMSLLVDLNRDRLFTVGMIALALGAGSWISSFL
ncbi:hypothetical protein [Pseudooceanicola sp.]|tara:strand:- start:4668 stop:4796 length:129 start_codon:yes stop_codon:yes gene_type:complete